MQPKRIMSAAFTQFAVTLMVNHACNLRCSYCYTGAKFSSPMPYQIGVAAIDAALRSTADSGRMELSFFGGEPLLEAAQILKWMNYARTTADRAHKQVRFSVTTNGTITTPDAWQVMRAEDLDLTISYDGSPEAHNRHRIDSSGRSTAHLVESTLRKLLSENQHVMVNAVVRPDTLAALPSGLKYLWNLGAVHVNLSLDLWTTWLPADALNLEACIDELADLWLLHLPSGSLSWFDVKAAELMGLPSEETVRCSFGAGEVAVAPSGNLYPCERLIGEDRPENPLRLPGHVLSQTDFLHFAPHPFARCAPCSQCALSSMCNTDCRCSNFIRTGNPNKPDGLLCRLNKAVSRSTARVLSSPQTSLPNLEQRKDSYAL